MSWEGDMEALLEAVKSGASLEEVKRLAWEMRDNAIYEDRAMCLAGEYGSDDYEGGEK